MTPKGKKDYHALLVECLNYRGQGGKGAHSRIVRLNAVYEDEEYREFCRIKTEDPEQFLDQYVEDLCLTFLQLRTIHEYHPNVKDWADGKLRTLYDSVSKAIRLEQESQPKETRTSYKKISDRLTEENQDMEYKLERTSSRLTESESEIETLRRSLLDAKEEIRDKERQVLTLEGRIIELQYLLKREAVTA